MGGAVIRHTILPKASDLRQSRGCLGASSRADPWTSQPVPCDLRPPPPKGNEHEYQRVRRKISGYVTLPLNENGM